MFVSVGGVGGVVAAGDVVVAVVVVDVEGAWLPVLSHPAVIATIATTATPRATAMTRRLLRFKSAIFLIKELVPFLATDNPNVPSHKKEGAPPYRSAIGAI